MSNEGGAHPDSGSSRWEAAVPQSDAPLSSFDPRALGRWLLILAIAVFCLAAAIAIGIILFSSFGETEFKILVSAVAIIGYSLTGLIATARFQSSPLGPVGLCAAGLGLLVMLLLIWVNPDSEALGRTAFAALVVVLSLAHANLLMPRPETDDGAKILFIATLVVNAVLTLLVVIPILGADIEGDGYWRLVGVAAVLLVLGTLLVPIVRKTNSDRMDRLPSVDARPEPTGEMERILSFSYRGRAFRVRHERPSISSQELTLSIWEIVEERPIRIAKDEPIILSDPHAAFGRAVEHITSAMDDGRL